MCKQEGGRLFREFLLSGESVVRQHIENVTTIYVLSPVKAMNGTVHNAFAGEELDE